MAAEIDFMIVRLSMFSALCFGVCSLEAESLPSFKVIAFYTGKNDLAHISFVNEANKWFPNRRCKGEPPKPWRSKNVLSAAGAAPLFLEVAPCNDSDAKIAPKIKNFMAKFSSYKAASSAQSNW